MTPLNEKAQSIVAAGRDGLRAPIGERERLEALIDARIAAGAAAPTAGKLLSFAAKAWPIGLGAVIAAGTAVFALRSEAPPAAHVRAAVPAVSAAPSVAVLPPAPPPAPAEVDTVSDGTPAEAATAAPRVTQDQLSLEVALLSRATSALRSGHAAEALKALDEHRRKFPNGFLTVERRAARAQALCSLQRVGEGRAELARMAPDSPAAARSRQVCDAVAAKTDRP